METSKETSKSESTMSMTSRQKIMYLSGVQVMALIVASNILNMLYRLSYIWWWPCFLGIAVFVSLSAQFLSETIEGNERWSRVDWKLLFLGASKYTIVFCSCSPMIWKYLVKIYECADLKGPMQYFCSQIGDPKVSSYYTPDHDDAWNTEMYAWLLFIPLLVVKMVVYEMLFDFGFYVEHRSFHEIPFLFHTCHKQHHTLTHAQQSGEDPLLKSWHTMNMDLHEVFLGVGLHVPSMMLVHFCFGSHPVFRLTGLDFAIIFGWIICWEHLGHVDSIAADTGPIPANRIVSGMLGLEAFCSKDHILHHELLKCNYSKRMKFWDWLFGTLEESEGTKGKWEKKRKRN